MNPFTRAFLVSVIAIVCMLSASPAVAADAASHQLWLYYPTNLLVDKNVDKIQEIWGRAAKAGYTHVLLADSKFTRLADMDPRYFKNVERVKKIAADLKLTIVPAMFSIGYSNDLLSRDPNLAEGLPVRDAPFVVKDGIANLQADPAIGFKAKWGFKDDAVKVEGNVAMIIDNTANARMNQKFKLTPFRHYHISVQVKTQNYTGHPEIKAIAGDAKKGEQPSMESLLIPTQLNWSNLHVKPTQDWTAEHITFNTLGHSDVTVYLGVWSKATGTLQWKDWKIEEVGILNVLRRPGAPVVVKDAAGKQLVEGKDYEAVKDPKMGNVPYAGEFTIYHEYPGIRTIGLAEGAKLSVSWYHPHLVYEGQVSCCPSEPKLAEILADQAARMKKLWGASGGGWMMNHDEIRSLNTDASCLATGKTPGQILADNVGKCVGLLKDSNVPIYTWNDMFDPFHNAVPGPYYLVNGPYTNSWEGLDKSVVIMNWNFGKRDDSLKFFADRGHPQILAGYYDHKPEQIRDWQASAKKVQGVVGVMYTTWKSDYSNIERFAEVAKEGW